MQEPVQSTSRPAPPRPGTIEPDPEPDSRAEVFDPARILSARQLDWLTATTRSALRALHARGEVRARIVADDEMADAHLKYSGIAGTTDVLTFDLREPAAIESGDPLDVDLWICADEARRNAADRAIPVERELLLYILHGVLHCLGHDDHDEAAHAAMHAEEDRILNAIGVGATFAAPLSPEAAK